MLSKDQSYGITERILYGVILFVAMKFVERGYMTADMAAYVAAGGVAAAGSVWAWLINRPGSLLTAAGNQLPKNSTLVITTTPAASPVEKVEARALADSASAKVEAKTSA